MAEHVLSSGGPLRGPRSICVFCGSRPGHDPSLKVAAASLGRAIAQRGVALVYGGAKVGLMGEVADAALTAGGRVVGVIPRSLVTKEIAHDGLSELHLTDSMAERKTRMMELSDAFVALPGGFGTYDELFETLTLAQIGQHEKPNALLDTNGYFAPLLALFEHTIRSGFAAEEHRGLLVVEREPEALLDALARWTPPPRGPKWVDRR